MSLTASFIAVGAGRSDRPLVGGLTDFLQILWNLSPTASFCVWAIYTHLGRLWEVAGDITLSIELRASPLYSSVHVLHLVSD